MKKTSELTVEEFTTPCPVSVEPQAKLSQVQQMMNQHGIRHIPVVNSEGQAIGIISDRDLSLLGHLDEKHSLCADDIMTNAPYTVTTNSLLEDVALEMSRQKIGSALVNNLEGQFEGIFTSTDGLNALVEVLRGEV